MQRGSAFFGHRQSSSSMRAGSSLRPTTRGSWNSQVEITLGPLADDDGLPLQPPPPQLPPPDEQQEACATDPGSHPQPQSSHPSAQPILPVGREQQDQQTLGGLDFPSITGEALDEAQEEVG
eukprot:5929142-Prymnesium_polylepis.1